MSRHLDFGHNRHASLGGIGDDLFQFRLGIVIAALRLGVVFRVCANILRLISDADRASGNQCRKLLDFDTPTLAIGEVDLQPVQFVQKHVVHISLHLFDGDIETGRIDQKPTPREPRRIVDGYAGNRELIDRCRRRILDAMPPRGLAILWTRIPARKGIEKCKVSKRLGRAELQ